MTILVYLIPVALLLGGLGLAAFLWALRSGQYEDLEGAASRILFDDDLPSHGSPHCDVDRRDHICPRPTTIA